MLPTNSVDLLSLLVVARAVVPAVLFAVFSYVHVFSRDKTRRSNALNVLRAMRNFGLSGRSLTQRRDDGSEPDNTETDISAE